MSTGKLVWYHVATHEWRDAPPKDGTWAMEHIQGRSPFSRLPSHLDIIDKLEQERAKLESELVAMRSLVQHWYKLVPENIRSSIEDAQKEAKP